MVEKWLWKMRTFFWLLNVGTDVAAAVVVLGGQTWAGGVGQHASQRGLQSRLWGLTWLVSWTAGGPWSLAGTGIF